MSSRLSRAGSKKLSDAELVCLAVAQVLLGARSEHHWLRMYYGRLGHLFPYLPKQPGYHQRGKTCTPLICQTTLHLATLFPSGPTGGACWTPPRVPCGTSRPTVAPNPSFGSTWRWCGRRSPATPTTRAELMVRAAGEPARPPVPGRLCSAHRAPAADTAMSSTVSRLCVVRPGGEDLPQPPLPTAGVEAFGSFSRRAAARHRADRGPTSRLGAAAYGRHVRGFAVLVCCSSRRSRRCSAYAPPTVGR
jgi:hypothetical protein